MKDFLRFLFSYYRQTGLPQTHHTPIPIIYNMKQQTSRIDTVDALRGFAVMAILLVHNLEHFIYPVYPTDSPAWLATLDKGVLDTVFSLFAGKAYAIFALLFGFTFHIQTSNQRKKGKDFGYRFLWRMLLLVVFATLNAAFFPGGDVLLLFASVSPVLFLTRNMGCKAILAISILFLLQPTEWYHYMAGLIDPEHQLPDLKVGEMYADIAACTKTGNIGEFLACNITLGQKASLLWAVNAGRFVQTAGLFLLGFYIGKKQLFMPQEQNTRTWTRILMASAIAFAPLYTLKELLFDCGGLVQQTVGTAFDMWQKLAFTLVLVSSFVLLYQNYGLDKRVDILRHYGKMSLTNYITQSIIGAVIYFPIGLHIAPYCGYTISLLIGLATFAIQAKLCKWWLSKHSQGPLERIWHKWTWIGKK